MIGYVIRRLALIIPTLFIASLIVFIMIRMIPGSVVDMMVGQHWGMTKEGKAQIEHELGLDTPIHIQYSHWVGDIITHGSLGESLWKKTSVSELIVERLPVTLELAILSLIIAQVIGVPVGVYSAMRQDSLGDYVGRSMSMICIAVPDFWLGTMIMVLPAVWWNWSPPVQMIPLVEDPLGNLGMFLIPACVMGMGVSGISMRMTRTMMLEVLRQDYIRTAWSKGLKEWLIVRRHALKNALIPVITIVGVQVPYLIGGVVIVEQIFSLPGIGRLMLDAVTQRDYPIVTGIMLFVGVFVVLTNLAIDLTYGFLDPRVKY